MGLDGPKVDTNSKDNSVGNITDSPKPPKPETIKEDLKEGDAEDEEGLEIHPYERLKISSADPVPDIDVTKREVYTLKIYQFVSSLCILNFGNISCRHIYLRKSSKNILG